MLSYSDCVWLYTQDFVWSKAVFQELFVGVGEVLDLYSPDLGNQDSISTLTLWLSWRQLCMWDETDFGTCKTGQSDQYVFQNLVKSLWKHHLYISMLKLFSHFKKTKTIPVIYDFLFWIRTFLRFSIVPHAWKCQLSSQSKQFPEKQ